MPLKPEAGFAPITNDTTSNAHEESLEGPHEPHPQRVNASIKQKDMRPNALVMNERKVIRLPFRIAAMFNARGLVASTTAGLK